MCATLLVIQVDVVRHLSASRLHVHVYEVGVVIAATLDDEHDVVWDDGGGVDEKVMAT
jgi:6-pyruvoyl-tetrahydropterin synthase